MLKLYLERLDLLERQILRMDQMTAEAMKRFESAVIRLAELPGFGANSAQQVIAEIGPDAKAFESAGNLASWVGVCPGSNVSAEHNRSSGSPKGNCSMRRILTQAAQAAVKKKGSYFQTTFRRWLPKLGFDGAIWAIAHKLCRLVWKVLHDQVSYIEQGQELDPKAKQRRAKKMILALRQLGYHVTISSPAPQPARA